MSERLQNKSLGHNILKIITEVLVIFSPRKRLKQAFGQGYSANALHLLQILAISSLPLGIDYIYTSILRVTGRLKEQVVIWGITTIAVLLGSFLIMPSIGIIGIGYTWLGAHTLMAIYILSTWKLALRS